MSLSFILRLAFLYEPFERDEGLYAYIGQEILRGGIPYKDAIENKPPGIYYLYAGFIALVGNSTEGIRLLSAGYSLLTVLSIYYLASHLYGARAGLLSSFFYGIFSSGPMIRGSSSQCEVFMVLPMVLSVYLFIRNVDTNKRIYLLLSGFLAGIAVFIKTTGLPNLLLILIFTLFTTKGIKDRALNMLTFLIPVTLMACFTFLYFSYHDALDDLIYWNFTYQRTYGRQPFSLMWDRFTTRGIDTSSEHLLLWMVAIPTVFRLLFKELGLRNILAVMLIPASLAAVFMPGTFWPHYFILMIPVLSILAGAGLAELWDERKKWFLIVLPVLVTAFLYSVKLDYAYYAVYSPEEVSANKYGTSIFGESIKIAKYIKERTDEDDYIFQWGWQPELYFLTDRQSPNRFPSGFFIALSANPINEINDILGGIITKRPKYIIVQNGRENWPGYYQLSTIIERYYSLEETIGYALIYRVKE